MTVSNLDFATTVDKWVAESEARLTAVFRESTQRVVSIASNGVPVDTGFARASVRASLSEMPQINPDFKGEKGQAYPFDLSTVVLTINGANIGHTVYVGWTAAYSAALENGHSKQAPSGFVRLAALQWPQIVAEVSAQAKALSLS